jgi:hypothetical protein
LKCAKSKPWHIRIKITQIFLCEPEMVEALQIGNPLGFSKLQKEGEFWERIMEEADEGAL